MKNIEELYKGVIKGNRRAIGKAITLIESSNSEHINDARKLLRKILPYTGKSIRLGLTGIPGVGKSTFIEAFGKLLTDKGHKVAVLAVDPSSQITGGSILGDKTRMEELSRDENAFIRPSPSKGTLGGISRYTRSTISVLEAAGYDVIIVETVGVGQSEIAVSNLTDMFLLLLSPGGGDELQGIKRGVMELADLIIINKADGDFESAANIAQSECKSALHLMRSKIENWQVEVLKTSAIHKKGLEDIWLNILKFKNHSQKIGQFDLTRSEQDKLGVYAELNELIMEQFKSSRHDEMEEIEQAVAQKEMSVSEAASVLYSRMSEEKK